MIINYFLKKLFFMWSMRSTNLLTLSQVTVLVPLAPASGTSLLGQDVGGQRRDEPEAEIQMYTFSKDPCNLKIYGLFSSFYIITTFVLIQK